MDKSPNPLGPKIAPKAIKGDNRRKQGAKGVRYAHNHFGWGLPPPHPRRAAPRSGNGRVNSQPLW